MISQVESEPEHSRQRYQKMGLENLAASVPVECHVLYDIVFIGIVTGIGYGEDAAQRFLQEMHQALSGLYEDNLTFMTRQQNLRPNILDKKLAADFRRIYNNNNTGIQMGTVAQAQSQVEEIKEIAQRSVEKQMNNLAEGERLLKTSQHMNELAQEFQKDAHTMESIQKSNAWWMCSKQCLAVFIGGPIALLLVILIVTWAICGSPFCL